MATRRKAGGNSKPSQLPNNKDHEEKEREEKERGDKNKKIKGKELAIRQPLANLLHVPANNDKEVIKDTTSTNARPQIICKGVNSGEFVAVFTSGHQLTTEIIIEEEVFYKVTLLEIDLQDREDPFYCTEYVDDIHSHMMSSERRDVYVIPETFLSNQTNITSEHRSVLVDWLIQVQVKFKLLQETLYIAIDTLDRYLNLTNLPKDQLQLTGAASLLIASKYEEIYAPSVSDFAYICADTYTIKQIHSMERNILKCLNYELNKPYALQFLRRYSKITSATKREHGLAKYILEQGLLDWKLCMVRPSKKAVSALLLSQSLLKRQPIDGALLFQYTGYTCEELKCVMYRLKSCLVFYKDHKLSAVRKKYEGENYLKASKSNEAVPELNKLALIKTCPGNENKKEEKK